MQGLSRQIVVRGALLALAMALVLQPVWAAPSAAVSGVVRDSQGVAQMGAMVQVLAANSVSVGSAFTDFYGRYRIANLVPGRYQVRATAALFVPATRGNLLLVTGALATVNLTLSMLSDTATWLPAERRKSDEPGDDWTWTLRSAANRPILRMVDDGQLVLVSSSAAEHAGGRPGTMAARASMMSGDGGFGGGGMHNVLLLDRVMDDGSDMVVRTDIAAARTPLGRGPATEFDAGFERRVALGGVSRLVVGYESHPEMMSAGSALGLQAMRIESAEKMHFGGAIDVEAGGSVYAVHTIGYAIASKPFFRVALHPGEAWAFKYRLATSREMQGFGALDTVEASLPMAAESNGRLRTESGTHQEVTVSRNLGAWLGGGMVEAALYRDVMTRTTVAGTGVLGAADLPPGAASSVVADTVTDAFQFFGNGYTARGINLTLTEPLTPTLWAAITYQTGAALTTQSASAASLAEAMGGLHAESAEAATVALKGRILRTGTKVRAAYRWQPRRLLTAVGPYEAFSDQSFFSFYARQAVRCRGVLPPGVEATIDVTNLLAQGYQPFLSADGRTLYLAQLPRTIQGGLSFTF